MKKLNKPLTNKAANVKTHIYTVSEISKTVLWRSG